jgi:hypothetical protein
MKKFFGICLVLGLTYCSVADKQDEEQENASEVSTATAPCDSIEKTMYDQHGNEYKAMLPCDSTLWPKGNPADTIIKIK